MRKTSAWPLWRKSTPVAALMPKTVEGETLKVSVRLLSEEATSAGGNCAPGAADSGAATVCASTVGGRCTALKVTEIG